MGCGCVGCGDCCMVHAQQLADEVWEDYTKSLVAKNRIPLVLKRVIAGFVRHMLGWEEEADLLVATGKRSVSEAWDLVRQRNELRAEFFDEWKKHNFNVVLCPPHVHPATPHGAFKDISHTAAYTSI